MRLEPAPTICLEAVTIAAALEAEVNDCEGGFPASAFDALRALGVTDRLPLGPGQATDLLWMLAATGRGDLSVGRILEGHINVLILVDRYGNDAQRARVHGLAGKGELFGVWNTDAPPSPLGAQAGILDGKKSFATGVDGLSHALVTVTHEGARRMILVPLAGLSVDRSWWRPLGMRASGSHIVAFVGLPIEPDWWLGGPDVYVEQPWFAAGAMRFVAVQVGGMQGILDVTLDHLRAVGRAADPYQRQRAGEMAAAVETGFGWLRRCADSWTLAVGGGSFEAAEAVATVNGARGAVERCCLDVLELAERSVGAAGLIAPHPLERRIRDLRTYLRQPDPDGALASFGDSVMEQRWTPGRRPLDVSQ